MKNLKTTIITALLMLAMASGAVAQEKWEYAIIQYYAGLKLDLTVSINGEKYEETLGIDKSTLSSKNPFFDLSPVLKKINEMQDKGWELYDQVPMSNGGSFTHLFYMRKKKQ